MARSRKYIKEHSLLKIKPDIAKFWDFSKNKELSPDSVTIGSTRMVWWICNKNKQHKWKRVIRDQINGGDCPFCAGKYLSDTNSLVKIAPKLAKEWHPTKNGKLTPYNISYGSKQKVWWKCDKASDHEWEATVYNRLGNRSGCPCCANRKTVPSNCLAVTHPKLVEQWSDKNNITPNMVSSGDNIKIWWKCKKGHEWQASIVNRTNINPRNKGGCPYCRSSYHEEQIAEILDKNQINFQRQKTFSTCRDIGLLRFDFCVYINKKCGLIEFHGEQHYRPVSFSKHGKKAEENFKYVQKHDKIKREWSQKNKIPLLEIPYYNVSFIEELIIEFVNKIKGI